MVIFSVLIGLVCCAVGVISGHIWIPVVLLVVACLAYAYIREVKEIKEKRDNRECKFCHEKVSYRAKLCPRCGHYIGSGTRFSVYSVLLKFLALIAWTLFVTAALLSAAYLVLKRFFPYLLDRYGL